MNTTSRVLGAAFLFQFVTSFGSAAFVRPLWLVPGDIGASLTKIAASPGLLRFNILLDMLTAIGIVWLGAMLFVTLRKHGEKMALVAFALYILEAMLLAGSQIAAFALLGIGQEYAAAGRPAYLQTLGNLALGSLDFGGSTLHMLVFCAGGLMFYYLLDKARIVPRALSLWGLIAALPFVIGIPLAVFGYQVPFGLYVPYVPFELAIGAWILAKGVKAAAA